MSLSKQSDGGRDGPERSNSDTTRTRQDDTVTDLARVTEPHRPESLKLEDDHHHKLELERRSSAVQALATSYTASTSSHGDNPFTSSADSVLNPKSPSFSAKEWAKSMVGLISYDGRNSLRSAGVCFQDLNVHGFHDTTDYHKDVGNIWLSIGTKLVQTFQHDRRPRVSILNQIDGIVRKGEMLVVLGPPGSGCSTFLRSIAGETNGLHIDDASYFNYQGISAKEMHTQHRGDALYTAEQDVHFPMLTVGDTLTFAAQARQPSQLPPGVDRHNYVSHLRDVIMAVFGISHTVDTMVGNDMVRGVSGGERKRVTICEAALAGAPLQCWDNSTRGLDSANAIEFCRALRLQTELFGSTACVSIYQAPQSAYDVFDKATVLYEGRQIFFGRADVAKQYFVDLGFVCPARQTTADFLTSMTSPSERIVREGFESRVPRTPDDFVHVWRQSTQFAALQAEIQQYKVDHVIGGPDAVAFRASKNVQQAKGQRQKSPYILTYPQQIQLCLWRGWKRLTGDPSITVFALTVHSIIAVIVGSLFYNLGETSSTFFTRGALLFYACMLNAFSSAMELMVLFAQRPIVEKHRRYAFYHPSAEGVASLICSLPHRIVDTIIFNLIIYFMTNLRRESGAFFFFLLMAFSTVMVMSLVFRTISAFSRTLFQALVPAGLLMLDLIIFVGFVIPPKNMLPWCRWLNYLDPIAYAFEAMMVNEFHDRKFPCDQYVPSRDLPEYANVGIENQVCSAVGSVPGQEYILGDDFVLSKYNYSWEHRWRNYGIMIAFTTGLMCFYLLAAEYISEKKGRGEVLLFRRGQKPRAVASAEKASRDAESGSSNGNSIVPSHWENTTNEKSGALQQHTSVYQWRDVCYDIKIKKNTRRILDHVDGWVKPGTLTALMGVSGAGKTSLLDCLADRPSIGIITGEMLVNGKPRNTSFQRSTGYVQQQDIHLRTSTVREALTFSALLRQPSHVPRAEKLAYVEEVIKMLHMEEYADAIIGVPGEALNIEQRKRLTIAVELVAKPPLLLFVDEPTSGLDSQTSWVILDLLDNLAKAGQAIICTIHQPSAFLFERFDRLLLLAEGGKTVYFGDIGEKFKTMVSYFERNGGMHCPVDANPAEWMLQVIDAAPGSTTTIDWFKTWRESPEYQEVHRQLDKLQAEGLQIETPTAINVSTQGSELDSEFAAPFSVQMKENLVRVFQQYWRTPTYIYSKASLCTLIPLFIGFVFFRAENSIQGLQSQMFSIFNLFTIFGSIVQQSIPQFVIQRGLYEARERPAKVYSWKAFILSMIIVELPWNCLMAVFMYCAWYYPVGLFRNAAEGEVTERGALVFLFLLMFMILAGSFSTFMVSGFNAPSNGGTLADLMFSLCMMFCGVLVPAASLPRFWIFMNRVSPMTYLVGGVLSVGVGNSKVVCAENELVMFRPTNGTSCGEYLEAYIRDAGGYLVEASARGECQFCPISETNRYLETVSVFYTDRWRNFGILWTYFVFNTVGALAIYYFARVPKKGAARKQKKE